VDVLLAVDVADPGALRAVDDERRERHAARDVPHPLGEDALRLCLLCRRHAWFRESRILCALTPPGRPSHFSAMRTYSRRGVIAAGATLAAAALGARSPRAYAAPPAKTLRFYDWIGYVH